MEKKLRLSDLTKKKHVSLAVGKTYLVDINMLASSINFVRTQTFLNPRVVFWSEHCMKKSLPKYTVLPLIFFLHLSSSIVEECMWIAIPQVLQMFAVTRLKQRRKMRK